MTSRTGQVPHLPEPDEAGYRAGRERLEAAFAGLRVDCGWVDGPFGRVFLAAGRGGLCRVGFKTEEAAFLDGLERQGLLPRLASERLEDARRELEEYFDGRRRRFEVRVELRGTTAFQRRVLDATADLGYGCVATYGEIARRIGQPGASRAVGNALGQNPVAIVVPCHRVVAAGGGLGGYTGGLDVKRVLLRLEGIERAGPARQ